MSGSRRKRISRAIAPADAATRQTRQRLKPDTLWLMLQRGLLSATQIEAAHAIRAAFQLIVSPVKCRTMDFEKLATGPDAFHGNARAAAADIGSGLVQRYLRWTDAMTRRDWPVGLVLDLAVEGMAIHAIARKWRWRRDSVRPLLADALDLFWIRE